MHPQLPPPFRGGASYWICIARFAEKRIIRCYTPILLSTPTSSQVLLKFLNCRIRRRHHRVQSAAVRSKWPAHAVSTACAASSRQRERDRNDTAGRRRRFRHACMRARAGGRQNVGAPKPDTRPYRCNSGVRSRH